MAIVSKGSRAFLNRGLFFSVISEREVDYYFDALVTTLHSRTLGKTFNLLMFSLYNGGDAQLALLFRFQQIDPELSPFRFIGIWKCIRF